MNEDGRPDAEEPWEPAYDAMAAVLKDAPLVRKAIRQWVAAWRASNPNGDEDVERLRALELVWRCIEDHRDRDTATDPNDPQSPWAGTLEC